MIRAWWVVGGEAGTITVNGTPRMVVFYVGNYQLIFCINSEIAKCIGNSSKGVNIYADGKCISYFYGCS